MMYEYSNRTTELVWLAGILEGEGSFFCLQGKPGNLSVSAGMTDHDVIQRVHRAATVGYVIGPYRPKNPAHKPFWTWRVGRTCDAAALMMTVYPLMGERRQEKIRELLLGWRPTPVRRRNGKYKARSAMRGEFCAV